MNLDDIRVALRPRTDWEAVDLGVRITRQWFGPMKKAWALTVLPFLLLVLGLCHKLPPLLTLLILFWLKPLSDRVYLFVLSRALFGSTPKVLETARQWKAWLLPGLVRGLTLDRFSPRRSFAMAVVMLERSRGAALTRRVSVLGERGATPVHALTPLMCVIELLVALMLTAAVWLMLPQGQVPVPWEMLLDTQEFKVPLSLQWIVLLAWLGANILLEPFYVGAGFALYLNSRTVLEGWDVELTFRRLATRVATPGRSVVVGLLLLLAVIPGVRGAARVDSPEAAKQLIEEVKADEAFEVHKIKVRYFEGRGGGRGNVGSLGSGIEKFVYIIWQITKVLLVLVLIGLLVWLVWRFRHVFRGHQRKITQGTEEERAKTEVVMGMDVRPESLPEDVLEAAWALWKNGKGYEAMRLLYRGALSRLVQQHGVPIVESDTEEDCLRRVRRQEDGAHADYFGRLTSAWVLQAYGSHPVAAAELEGLMRTWPYSGSEDVS